MLLLMTKQSSGFIAPHKLSPNLCLADLQRYSVSELQLGVSHLQVDNHNSWEMNNFRGFFTFLCDLKQLCGDVYSTWFDSVFFQHRFVYFPITVHNIVMTEEYINYMLLV